MKNPLRSLVVLLAAGSLWAQENLENFRRFALAYMPQAAGPLEIRLLANGTTPGGHYLLLMASSGDLETNRGEVLTMIADPQAGTVNAGFALPLAQQGIPAEQLPSFAEKTLPQVLSQGMGGSFRIHWPSLVTKPSAVMQLETSFSTGYGWVRFPVAITGDGKYLIIGESWPLGKDPRQVRRERMRQAQLVPDFAAQDAKVTVVEFSDMQCPACKRAWGELKPILEKLPVAHVSAHFPLVTSHPWAFRAAAAAVCLGQKQRSLIPIFKDFMFARQGEIKLENVDDAVFAFLSQRGLDESNFRRCYMTEPILQRVLEDLALGYRLGVMGTPSYFAGGEHLPLEPKAFEARLRAIIQAGGIAEKAQP